MPGSLTRRVMVSQTQVVRLPRSLCGLPEGPVLDEIKLQTKDCSLLPTAHAIFECAQGQRWLDGCIPWPHWVAGGSKRAAPADDLSQESQCIATRPCQEGTRKRYSAASAASVPSSRNRVEALMSTQPLYYYSSLRATLSDQAPPVPLTVSCPSHVVIRRSKRGAHPPAKVTSEVSADDDAFSLYYTFARKDLVSCMCLLAPACLLRIVTSRQ